MTSGKNFKIKLGDGKSQKGDDHGAVMNVMKEFPSQFLSLKLVKN